MLECHTYESGNVQTLSLFWGVHSILCNYTQNSVLGQKNIHQTENICFTFLYNIWVKLFFASDKHLSQKYMHFFMFVTDAQFLPEVKCINKSNYKSPTSNFMKIHSVVLMLQQILVPNVPVIVT